MRHQKRNATSIGSGNIHSVALLTIRVPLLKWLINGEIQHMYIDRAPIPAERIYCKLGPVGQVIDIGKIFSLALKQICQDSPA